MTTNFVHRGRVQRLRRQRRRRRRNLYDVNNDDDDDDDDDDEDLSRRYDDNNDDFYQLQRSFLRPVMPAGRSRSACVADLKVIDNENCSATD